MCIIITVIISYSYIEEKNKAKQRLPSKEDATTQLPANLLKKANINNHHMLLSKILRELDTLYI